MLLRQLSLDFECELMVTHSRSSVSRSARWSWGGIIVAGRKRFSSILN